MYYKKDEGALLDATVMPWLNKDLKRIKNSQLRFHLVVGKEEGSVKGSV